MDSLNMDSFELSVDEYITTAVNVLSVMPVSAELWSMMVHRFIEGFNGTMIGQLEFTHHLKFCKLLGTIAANCKNELIYLNRIRSTIRGSIYGVNSQNELSESLKLFLTPIFDKKLLSDIMLFEDLTTELDSRNCLVELPYDMKHWTQCTMREWNDKELTQLFYMYAAVYKYVVKTVKPLELQQDIQKPCTIRYHRKHFVKLFHRQLACILENLPEIVQRYKILRSLQ
jgi:hypothetical protein